MVTLTEIWKLELHSEDKIFLARAYYRTGQLSILDQPVMAGVIWNTLANGRAKVYTSEGIALNDTTSTIDEYMIIEEVISPELVALVEQAVQALNPLQLKILRLAELALCLDITWTAVAASQVTEADKIYIQADLAGEVVDFAPHYFNSNLELPEAGPEPREAYTQVWRALFRQHQRLRVVAYINIISRIHHGNEEDELKSYATSLEGETPEGAHPLLAAYLHLVRHLLQEGDAVATAAADNPPAPQLFEPIIPSKAPTYDQVVARLETLL